MYVGQGNGNKPWDTYDKLEIDAKLAAQNAAAEIASTAVGNISATNVQAALQELDTEKVAKTGDETIAGVKTFSNNAIFNNNVGIGTNSPIARLHSNVGIGDALALNGGSYKGLSVLSTNTNASVDGGLKIKQVSNGSMVSAIELQGSDNGSGILLYAGNVERMRIDTSGNVIVTGSGGLGYGTGSGGTVTQLTNKSTAVTLNKPCGQILMNNNSLAAGEVVYFLLNNSTITFSDTVVATFKDGSAGDIRLYRVEAISQGSGYAWMKVTNTHSSALAESPVIKFAVIKGATA